MYASAKLYNSQTKLGRDGSISKVPNGNGGRVQLRHAAQAEPALQMRSQARRHPRHAVFVLPHQHLQREVNASSSVAAHHRRTDSRVTKHNEPRRQQSTARVLCVVDREHDVGRRLLDDRQQPRPCFLEPGRAPPRENTRRAGETT